MRTLLSARGWGEACMRPVARGFPGGDHKDRPYGTAPIFCGVI